MTREIEFRLLDHPSAAGELLAADAVGLIQAFKDVTYRLTRSVADRPGLGRTAASLESLATVRVALRPGSTRLVFVVGDSSALLDPLADGVDAIFWSIVEALETNRRPADVSDSIAESVDGLVVALKKAAPRAEITVPGHAPRLVETDAIRRGPWKRGDQESAGPATLYGILEMVDLHTRRFRLRDTAGNTVDLHDVMEAETAAALVGHHVRVSGLLGVGSGTQHHRVDTPQIERAEPVATRLGIESPPSLESLVAHAHAHALPEPIPLEISDEEMNEFLAAIRG